MSAITMGNKPEKDIMRRFNVVIGQVHGIRKMLKQHREFIDIYMQLSSVKASIEEIEVMLIAEDIKLDKGSAALFKIISKRMDALRELQ